MSDWGGSQGWLRDDELAAELCSRGDDCHCTGNRCRMGRELRERRAADLTDEEFHWLSLLPSVVEVVYERAVLESAINGTQEPKRENIEKTKAALAKVLGAKP